MLSRGTARWNVKLQNFQESCIVVNKEALNEMELMRKESVLQCTHPLKKLGKPNICLYNLVSWNKHLQHFLSDEAFSLFSSVFCFTETHVGSEFKRIKEYLPTWKDIHEPSGHGLSICYNEERVQVIQEFS